MITDIQLKKIKEEVSARMRGANNPLHEMDHIEEVVENAKKLLKILNPKKELDRNLLLSCCYLHDLTYANSPFFLWAYLFEGKLVRKPASKVLKDAEVNPQEKVTIINAISKHPHSFPFRKLNKNEDSYTKILQDSDTLELFNEERIKKLFNNINTSRGILKKLIRSYIKYGFKNLEKYLNYPEIVDDIRAEYFEEINGKIKSKKSKNGVEDRI